MKKPTVFIVLLLMAGCLPVVAQPPVFTLDIKALEKNKGRIMSKDKLILPAFRHLTKDAGKALQFGPVSVMEKKNIPPSGDKHDYMSLAPYHWPDTTKPGGLPYIRKDGQTNPEVKEYKDKEYMPKLCDVVHTLALAYYYSGDEMYAEHASKLLRVWFLDTDTRMNPNLNYGQAIKGVVEGRGAGLIDTRHFIKVIDAIGLLENSRSWTKANQEGMKKWFGDFLNWMQTSKNGLDESDAKNNHGAWYDAQRLAISLFIGDMEGSKKIVMNALQRLDNQMDNTGSFPLEMARTTSLHYTVFAMDAFFLIAQMAEKTGIDFWNYSSPSGKSLRKGFEAMYPYISREKEWTGQQIKEYNFEESIPLMIAAAKKLDCKKCITSIKSIAADKTGSWRIKLLTDIDF